MKCCVYVAYCVDFPVTPNLATEYPTSTVFAGPKPGNKKGCGRKDIWHKTLENTGIILVVICVAAAAAGQLVSSPVSIQTQRKRLHLDGNRA